MILTGKSPGTFYFVPLIVTFISVLIIKWGHLLTYLIQILSDDDLWRKKLDIYLYIFGPEMKMKNWNILRIHVFLQDFFRIKIWFEYRWFSIKRFIANVGREPLPGSRKDWGDPISSLTVLCAKANAFRGRIARELVREIEARRRRSMKHE